MSLDWLGQIFLKAAGEYAWHRAILSVRENILDCLRPASEVLDEVLLEMMGRSEAEDCLRLTHIGFLSLERGDLIGACICIALAAVIGVA